MTNFLHWHKMTWALVLWSGYIATWMVVTGSGPAIGAMWWLAGLGLLQVITQLLSQTGRVEPSRRHGPFDPRFSRRPNAARRPATNDDPRKTSEQADTGAFRREDQTVQDWESEGGAIAEPLRGNPRARAA
jgi:hypothetical protein